LVHDDIMDAAPLRRGKRTVHKKWDVNTGILSGDAMLIEAYRLLETYEEGIFKKLMVLFSRTAMEVCEGQQYDVDFETRDDVTIPEYLQMIKYKTAVLVATAMKMGAIIGEAPQQDQEAIYAFGLNLGIAFQLQDDFLDAFGDPKTFGKQLGGDIIENKKTFLYLKSLELGESILKKELIDLFSIQPKNNAQKIKRVKAIYDQSGASEYTREAITKYTQKAFENLQNLDVPEDKKAVFRKFGEELMGRSV
ncbi:MAG: polyprenyl synthetase family protein, partial [Eudoraea sp.]|nr:polyprenyl synthetase family protein [Eudoraea sp.]